jgi:hypothetical protein
MAHRSVVKAATRHRTSNGYSHGSDRVRNTKQSRRQAAIASEDEEEPEDEHGDEGSDLDRDSAGDGDGEEDESDDGDAAYLPEKSVCLSAVCFLLC